MGRLRCLALCAFALLSRSLPASGEESLSPEMVQRLKDATVYVKTDIGPLKMTGSGFVIEVTGNTALIATNQHVIAKPKVLEQGSYIPGLRGRDRLALARMQQALAAAEPAISVVFGSGNGNEQTIKAELIGELVEPDLAILRVSGINTAPTPISFRQPAPPFETMPVYIIGFPFGDVLATNKGNPTITIGKGSVSSIRNDANGKLAKLQIDGALNPGNSGGPVVDSKGNLVGIAVQTIQGSNIGLAIPPGELSSVLDGRIGTPTVVVGKTEKGNAPTYEVIVPMIDPMKKLKSVSLHFVDGSAPIDQNKKGEPQLQSVAGSQKVDLTMNDRTAKAALPLPATADQKAREVTVQAAFVNAEGKTVHLEPVVVKVAAPILAATTVSKEGNTTTYSQTTQNPGGGTSRRTVTITQGGGSAPSKMSKMKEDDDDAPSKSEKIDSDKVAKKSTTTKEADKPKTKTKPNEDSSDSDSKKVAEIAWTNKISKMKKIPDEEVTGKIDGLDFVLDRVSLTNAGLTFEMGPRFRGVFSEASLDIVLFLKPNEDVSGRRVVVNGQVGAGTPHVRASAMRKGDNLPRTQAHLDYLMILEFGDYNAEERIQPGKIYICLPDRGKSFLAGSFEAAAR